MRRLLAEIAAVVAIGIAAVMFVSTTGLGDRLRSEQSEAELPQYCHDRDLAAFDGSPIRGMAFLCLDGRSVELIAAPERLTPGRGYTAWMLYTNHPRLCRDTGCEAPRADDPNGRWLLARIGGAVADSQGAARISTSYRGLRLVQGATVLVTVVDGSDPRADAIHERARRVLGLPDAPANSTSASSVGAVSTVDSGTGAVAAHALFTLAVQADN
jgi:hypothetical protein